MRLRKLILIIIFIILVTVSSLIGVLNISILDLIKLNQTSWKNFMYFRIPRTVSIVLVSSSLAMAGLIMQSISRNKFISPTTSGAISSSQLGLLIGIISFAGAGLVTRFIFAFVFSLVFSVLFMIILNKIKLKNEIYIPLIGIMFSGIIGSITMFIAGLTNKIQTVQSWSVGSFSLLVQGRYEILYVVLIPLVLAYVYATKFSIVGMGEDFSKNLGINYKTTVFIGLILVSIISSITYILVGPLPFLGLIIPNIVKLYYGDNLKKSYFDVMLASSIFVLTCDIIARLARYPYELPVSFVSGTIGGFIFLIILYRSVKK